MMTVSEAGVKFSFLVAMYTRYQVCIMTARDLSWTFRRTKKKTMMCTEIEVDRGQAGSGNRKEYRLRE